MKETIYRGDKNCTINTGAKINENNLSNHHKCTTSYSFFLLVEMTLFICVFISFLFFPFLKINAGIKKKETIYSTGIVATWPPLRCGYSVP